MEYAIWYQDCLLRMEDVLVKRLEAKIEVILDRKILEYIEKTRNKNNSIIHL